MAKSSQIHVCQACGAVSPRWAGRCESCGEWNTIQAESAATAKESRLVSQRGGAIEFVDLNAATPMQPRARTGIGEFDRVCGGGFVAASALLIGGDPGVGKSTLLLQVAARMAESGATTAYVTGEEAEAQVRDRARRIGVHGAPVKLTAETDLGRILEGLKALRPAVVIVDSIQTMWSDQIDAAPGTVAQVRACAQDLVRFAKRSGATLLLVGHITKDGQIAGPRVVEHLVDAVMYFEGERGAPFRILRSVKNRFGATDEIGVFEMKEHGLEETPNPSALFLSSGAPGPGAAIFAGVEGTRPVLVEIQALAAPTNLGSPRRAVVGWDPARLAMILAVLETRCGLGFAGLDVYLSVAGGLRISEPAADLAVAAALISAVADTPLPEGAVVFGEIALSGGIRPASRAELRLKEAAKLGFGVAFAPPGVESSGVRVREIATIGDLAAVIGPT